MNVLFRMGFYHLFVELYAEAGALRKLEVAAFDLGQARGSLADPGVGEVVEVLLYAEVSGAGGQVEGCCCVDLTSTLCGAMVT